MLKISDANIIKPKKNSAATMAFAVIPQASESTNANPKNRNIANVNAKLKLLETRPKRLFSRW